MVLQLDGGFLEMADEWLFELDVPMRVAKGNLLG